MTYLLDTNVVSEWTKPRPNPRVIDWLKEVDEDEVFLSVCTLAELRYGIAQMPAGRKRERLDGWLTNDILLRFEGRVIPVDTAVAEAWGWITARAKSAGRRIDVMDGLIAATSVIHQMTVVTRDVSDFRAAGARTLSPWAGE